jgi:hypothetical protein
MGVRTYGLGLIGFTVGVGGVFSGVLDAPAAAYGSAQPRTAHRSPMLLCALASATTVSGGQLVPHHAQAAVASGRRRGVSCAGGRHRSERVACESG